MVVVRLGIVVVVAPGRMYRVRSAVRLVCVFCHVFVVAVAAAVWRSPVVLWPVYSCRRFPVLVQVVRLLEFWIVHVYVPMVHTVVMVRGL